MDRLISQLVDATRIGHGELTVSTRPEPVGAIVDETVDLYATTARERDIVLEAADLPRGLSCKPTATASCRCSAI